MKNKQLILSLIKDDLINSKLVSGLNGLGLGAGIYFLNLSDTIFTLMGIDSSKQGEALFEHYLELRNKAAGIDPDLDYEKFDVLAVEIYEELRERF